MIVYFIMFSLSFFNAYIAEKQFKIGNKNGGKIFSIIAILLPVFFAALRVEGIGTDTTRYIHNVFELSNKLNNLKDAYIVICNNLHIELNYMLINYLISRITHNINVIYFINEFIIILFIYFACFNGKYGDKKYENASIYYFLYLILFFNKTLNLCRQSIAIAIFLYSLKFVNEKKWWKYLFSCIMASLFHQSAIILILIYPLNLYLNKGKKKISVIIFLLLTVCFYRDIMYFFINSGLLAKKYIYYIEGDSNIIIMELMFMISIFLISLLIKKDKKNDFYYLLYLFGILTYFIGFYSSYSYRISYYFYTLIIFLIPDIKKLFLNYKKTILFLCLLSIMYYSYIYYEVNGFDETIPYRSIIQVYNK